MKLVIIGNGFDINHKLDTSYSMFKDHISQTDPNEYDFLKDLFGDSFENDLFWKEFEESLAKANFESFGNTLEEKDYFDKHIFRLKELFCKWIKQTNNFENKNKNDIFSKCFEDSIVLSFNYTSTVEKLYDSKCYHIHGWIENVDIENDKELDSIILGHSFNISFVSDSEEINGDNMYFETDDGKIIPLSETTFVKDFNCSQSEYMNKVLSNADNYYEQIFTKRCNSIIEQDVTGFFSDLSKNANSIDEIVILGHSISEVDINYYKKILEILKANFNKIKWTVSFHGGEEAKDDLRNNLNKVGVSAEIKFISI